MHGEICCFVNKNLLVFHLSPFLVLLSSRNSATLNSHSVKLDRSYSISFLFGKCWRNFLGLNLKGPYLSLEKEKDNFCVVFTYSLKQACEIRTFHDLGVQ